MWKCKADKIVREFKRLGCSKYLSWEIRTRVRLVWKIKLLGKPDRMTPIWKIELTKRSSLVEDQAD